jgi:parvulin-like peptidyl-prolyl isomerase
VNTVADVAPVARCGARRRGGRSAPLGAAACAFLVLLAAVAPCRAAILEEIVAKVNNKIISKSEFEQRGTYILQQVYQEYSGAELDRQLKEAQDTMLANMITELLLVEQAESLLDISKVRKNLIDDFKKQQNIPNDDELEKALKQQGMTRADLEEQLVRMAVPQEVINYEVKRKISVSDREVETYYDEHLMDWMTPARVTFREIVLFHEEANTEEVRTRAQGIVREVKAGADFGELVDRSSEAGTKESGGLIGPVAFGDIQPQIASVAFKMEEGQTSDPIDTGKSFHVIKIEAKTPEFTKTILEVHDAIYDAIRQEKFKPRYDRYLKGLWRNNVIEVMPKYQKFLIASPLNPAAASAAGG